MSSIMTETRLIAWFRTIVEPEQVIGNNKTAANGCKMESLAELERICLALRLQGVF